MTFFGVVKWPFNWLYKWPPNQDFFFRSRRESSPAQPWWWTAMIDLVCGGTSCMFCKRSSATASSKASAAARWQLALNLLDIPWVTSTRKCRRTWGWNFYIPMHSLKNKNLPNKLWNCEIVVFFATANCWHNMSQRFSNTFKIASQVHACASATTSFPSRPKKQSSHHPRHIMTFSRDAKTWC